MRMKNIIAYIMILLLTFISCTENIKLENVLEDASDNRLELLKVLDHYKKSGDDPLKFKAAMFLIANMDGHYSKNNAVLECMTRKFNISDTIVTDYRQIREWWMPFKGDRRINNTIYDLKYLKADFLIDNIDAAYDSWTKAPWHKDVSFDDFCNYILPYRFEDEPVVMGWRDSLKKTYADVIGNEKDLKKAFAALRNAIWERTRRGNSKFPLLMNVLAMKKQGCMNCRQGCVFLGDVARSLGMPVVMDKVFQWANYSKQGHNWIALTYSGKTFTVNDGDTVAKNQKDIDASFFPDKFKLDEHYPLNTKFRKTMPKIYRCLFAGKDKTKGEDFPVKLMDTHYVDVSKVYSLNGRLNIRLDYDSCLVFLCTFADSPYWTPIACKKKTNANVLFDFLGDSIVYLPMKHVNQKFAPLSNPIILAGNHVRYLEPNKMYRHKVKLTRKYPFSSNWTNKWGSLIGGSFEVSNDSLFLNSRKVYTICNMPLFRNTIKINGNKKYRYIRYLSNNQTNLMFSELQVYSDKGLCKGRIIGNTSCCNEFLFDGCLTNSEDNKVKGYFVGMDLGHPEKIAELIYYPVNDGNFVIPDMEYELFYYDFGWVSLGKKISKSFSVTFDNVPQNALLLLRNRARGNEERIFTYENGKQIWW